MDSWQHKPSILDMKLIAGNQQGIYKQGDGGTCYSCWDCFILSPPLRTYFLCICSSSGFVLRQQQSCKWAQRSLSSVPLANPAGISQDRPGQQGAGAGRAQPG